MSTSTSATEGAATVPETEAPVPGKTTSKDVGWYTKELPELDPAVRELLENYSHVRADDVEGHILKSVCSPRYDLQYYLADRNREIWHGMFIHIHA